MRKDVYQFAQPFRLVFWAHQQGVTRVDHN